ncbi:MAG: ABC transporter permease [Candidatus Bathyarchaeia archaeon]
MPKIPILKFIAKRLATGILVMLGISLITFIALSLVPGDPAQVILSYAWTPEAGAALREKLGLNDPLYIQYARFLWNAFHGDLGKSYLSNLPVVQEIYRASIASLQLTLTALVISFSISIILGVFSAVKRRSILDNVSRILTIGLSSVPVFVLGLILMYVFAVELRILPATGRGGTEHLILPATTLAAYSMAGILRMTRASMLEVLRQDYIRTARSKGLSERKIVFKHALRNAMNPIITLMGLYIGVMIGSAIITEYVFAWPGIGTVTITAIFARDIPMIQGGVLVIAGVYVVVNLIVDVLYAYFDPRIRVR